MKVVILCGGKGTRLKEQTEQKPKPLVEIGGKPILWHLMKIYSHFGHKHFVLALGYKGWLIKEYFMNYDWLCNDFTLTTDQKNLEFHSRKNDDSWTIEFVDTGEDSLSSLRLYKLKHLLQNEDNFMLTYCDGLSDIDLNKLVDFHLSQGKLITLTGINPKHQYGILSVDNNHTITEFKEKPILPFFINAGFMVLNKKVFDLWDDRNLMLEEVLPEFAQRREIALYPHSGFWKSMDTYKDYLEFNELWEKDPAWKVWDKNEHQIKKVLITGGAGFIGSHTAELLVSLGYEVSILEKGKENLWRIEPILAKINYWDLNEVSLEDVFSKNQFDAIIHLATFYRKSQETSQDIREMNEVNVLFPLRLLELAVQGKIKYFVNAGTFFEYFIPSQAKISESAQISPYNLYASTKVAFETVLKNFVAEKGLKAVTLKLFAPFGEKDNEKVLVRMTKALLLGREVELTGGEQKWDFTYVADIAAAFALVLEYLPGAKTSYDTFNIGQDEVVSLRQAAAILETISQKKLLAAWGKVPYPENEIFYVNCDNAKAKNTLGWQPSFDFQKGLLKMYSYYLRQYEQGNL